MCKFFGPVIIATYKEGAWKISGRTVSGEVHPVGALNKTFISGNVNTYDRLENNASFCLVHSLVNNRLLL